MRISILAALLFVAACAPAPAPAPTSQKPAPQGPAATDQHDHRALNGMTANELTQHFGTPRLQVREGDGTKLQFMGPACVIDFYLYPDGRGTPRVSHIDARNLQGADIDAQACVYAIEAR
jgi:hypothetical protein